MGSPYYFPIIYDASDQGWARVDCSRLNAGRYSDFDVSLTFGDANDRGATCPVVTFRLSRAQALQLAGELTEALFEEP